MAIWLTCDSALSIDDTRARVASAKETYADVLKYFWISDVAPALGFMVEDGKKYGLAIKCGFLVQWNKEGGSEFIPEIPRIMYKIFGHDNLLVYGLDRELIR